MDTLIFVDTNILLDFYRVRGREGGLSILDHIDSNHESIITSSQIEMEFKKNRQRAILETHKLVGRPDWKNVKPPVFLLGSQPSKMIEKMRKDVDAQASKIQERILKVLHNPAQTDPVYKVVQRLFRSRAPWNLSREKKVRQKIRRLARKRFLLGYPPRKPDDTSMGDAVNWEWIVHCAKESGASVIIVSRDSDYGETVKGEPVLNDWLTQEFKERVSRQRTILLTDRLTTAFRRASIRVSRKEEKAEEEFIKSQKIEQHPLPKATLDALRVFFEESAVESQWDRLAKSVTASLLRSTTSDPSDSGE